MSPLPQSTSELVGNMAKQIASHSILMESVLPLCAPVHMELICHLRLIETMGLQASAA